MALGLGQIAVKSRPGQPFLAEIPVIASNPVELQDLKVRLASAETYRRVGLQPPSNSVDSLQFLVALDGQSQPVIRVSSQAPITQPLLTFLLEVDWGSGRLVREYSALLATPQTVAAPMQAIQAPTVAQPNVIQRPVATAAPIPLSLPAPMPAPAKDADVAVESLPAAEPPPEITAAAPPEKLATIAADVVAPAPVASPSPSPAAVASTAALTSYAVRAGDTLGAIARQMGQSGRSLDQAMLALLHANPEAFIGGNINLVRQGAVLRMPQSDEYSRYSAGEAATLVREQVAQWREAQAPQLQPLDSGVAVAVAKAPSRAPPVADAVTAANTGARLEIAPPSAGGSAAGMRSGTQAGGEGKMLRQEIQETQETLAARDVEVGELKARVAELEKLQLQQKQLIAMKDTALAAARENLANAATTQEQPVAPAADAGNATGLWPWLLAGLVLALVAGWWFMRGRKPRPPQRAFDAGALAKRVPSPPAVVAAAPGPAPAPAPAPAPEPELKLESEPELAPAASDWIQAAAAIGTVPGWHEGAEVSAEEAVTRARQIELARACLDLGDDAAAIDLLNEVLKGRDLGARDIAARMLRDRG
ncbi:MAG: FimV/HubP family polar landmark protein [Luteimonas sp.]